MHVFCLKLEMQVNKWVLFLYILNLKCEKCVLCCMLLTHFTIYIFKSPFSLPPSTRFNLRENLRANNFRQNWKYSLENQGESSENHQIGCQCVQCSIVSWLSVHSVQQSADLLCTEFNNQLISCVQWKVSDYTLTVLTTVQCHLIN